MSRKYRKIIFIFFFVVAFFVQSKVFGFDINGFEIPLPENATLIDHKNAQKQQPTIYTFAVVQELQETVTLYEQFFSQSQCQVIGGMQEEGFNASVRMQGIMFSIRIFPEGNHTIIQFIW